MKIDLKYLQNLKITFLHVSPIPLGTFGPQRHLVYSLFRIKDKEIMMKCRKNTALHGIFLLQPDVLHFLQGLAQAALETFYHLKVSKRLV